MKVERKVKRKKRIQNNNMKAVNLKRERFERDNLKIKNEKELVRKENVILRNIDKPKK